MSSNPNSGPDGSDKYSYPRKVMELGRSHISASTFHKVVETERDDDVKEKGLQGVKSSKDQVNKLARDLRPFSYFSDKPSIATTSDLKDLQNDISERRNDFQTRSELAKARAEALAKGQSHNTEQSVNASSYQPISPPPVQRPVDRRITDYSRLSQDTVKPTGTATRLIQEAVIRPPSEAFSVSELPRAPSLEVPLQALPPPPRNKGVHAIQPIAAPVSASTSTSTSAQAQAQGQSPLATSTGTTTVERTGSMQPVTPLPLASQSSTSSGQAPRKGKHRRGINTGGADDNQEQPATGTFGQEIDFVKAGINPGKRSADK